MAVTIKGGTLPTALCWERLASICSILWLICDSASTEQHLQGLRVRLLLRALLLVPNSKRNEDKDESHYLYQQGHLMAGQIYIFIIIIITIVYYGSVSVTLIMELMPHCIGYGCSLNLKMHLKAVKYTIKLHLVVKNKVNFKACFSDILPKFSIKMWYDWVTKS